MNKKIIKLINSERVQAKIISAKGCTENASDTCVVSNYDKAHCSDNALDYCYKDYAACYGNAYDYCSNYDRDACYGNIAATAYDYQ